jgi:hypothetical protein
MQTELTHADRTAAVLEDRVEGQSHLPSLHVYFRARGGTGLQRHPFSC